MNANLAFPSAGKPMLTARVEFIYPTLTERTRTVRVRFEVGNSDGALRPGLFGTASFGEATRSALTVPRDAVVDTGETQHVFVRAANGILEPRSVRLGARVADRVEVLEGLAPGETVVASGVFLIDSESRLRASGGGGHSGHAAPREQADHSAHGG
jgi:Cu(I)/Ag(I) efflux system membrane fusion protein